MNAKNARPILGVIGLGLIGGSIAAALSPRYTVYGTDLDPETARFARAQGMIAGDAYEHLREADVVLIATPISAVSGTIADVFSKVGTHAIVSDVASVKSAITAELPDGIRYVGGHPMAGKERGGIRSYSPALFENAVYVVTRARGTTDADVETIKKLATDLGAIPVETTTEAHDAAVSKISHLPHMIAYTLSKTVPDGDLSQALAAGSFRDMTRVAASDPAFWTSVAFSNRENLLKDMRAFEKAFRILVQDLEEGNGQAVAKAFADGKRSHDAMTERSIGSTDVLFVEVADRPLALAEIATVLGEHGVNITGLQIFNSREGIGGALKLEFCSKEACENASKILSRHGYKTER